MQRSVSRWPWCTCLCGKGPQLVGTSSARVWSLQDPSVRQSSSSSNSGTSTAAADPYTSEDYHDIDYAQLLNQRVQKTKKRIVKRGQDFVDKLTITVKAGKGGDGGVAFHREKFVEFGGPSGGNGGHGGNVYIQPSPRYSSLSHIKKTMSAHNGQAGMGTWQHGRRGNDLVIEVPYGTVVRELRQAQHASNDAVGGYEHNSEIDEEDGSSHDETWSAWRKRIKREKLADPEVVKERRKKMFVFYPTLDEETQILDSKTMDDLEMTQMEDERRLAISKRTQPLFEIDFDSKPARDSAAEEGLLGLAPEGTAAAAAEKVLLLRGGQGGFGNPYFAMPGSRKAPKIATRGKAGESMRLELELKTLADIGLVGLPNAGKSTLLQALTHSRSTIASYAFTTLSPQIGTLIIFDDNTYSTTTSASIIEESAKREQTDSAGRERKPRPTHKDARQEKLRLTIADCPGLLPHAADDFGLGHDFLRHIERSQVLVYVVDLSGANPVKDLEVLKTELEDYKAGLSSRARVIVANKADQVAENDSVALQSMKRKLDALRDTASRWEEIDGVQRTVIPMSAKQRGNVQLLVDSLVTSLH